MPLGPSAAGSIQQRKYAYLLVREHVFGDLVVDSCTEGLVSNGSSSRYGEGYSSLTAGPSVRSSSQEQQQ